MNELTQAARRKRFSDAIAQLTTSIPEIRRIHVSCNESDGVAVLPPIEFNPDSLCLLKPKSDAAVSGRNASPTFARGTEATELKAWRLLGAGLSPVLDRILAAQGELPWPEVVKLQHALAELLPPPAAPSSEHSTSTPANS